MGPKSRALEISAIFQKSPGGVGATSVALNKEAKASPTHIIRVIRDFWIFQKSPWIFS